MKVPLLLHNKFTSQNTMPASKLRNLSQKKLKRIVEENTVIGLIIKDELAIAMMGMKDYERLLKYVEELEQIVEEAMLIKKVGIEELETSKEEFIEMPENLSVKEYREWRKNISK